MSGCIWCFFLRMLFLFVIVNFLCWLMFVVAEFLRTDPPPGASFPYLSSTSDLSSFSLTAIDALKFTAIQIHGPEGAVYEKGYLRLRSTYPNDEFGCFCTYPFQPPIVPFAAPIYHPNIDTGGRNCLDFLNFPAKTDRVAYAEKSWIYF